jgi:hypothetical protein
LTAEISREWFPEPARADDTYLRRGEPITSWLKRSTIPGAKECRHFLNENLSSLPSGHQRVLYQALHNRWHSAFFEVIVARTLQVLSAEIEIEPGSETGTRMDLGPRPKRAPGSCRDFGIVPVAVFHGVHRRLGYGGLESLQTLRRQT